MSLSLGELAVRFGCETHASIEMAVRSDKGARTDGGALADRGVGANLGARIDLRTRGDDRRRVHPGAKRRGWVQQRRDARVGRVRILT